MKIVIANKYYFHKSGPERYMMAVIKLLTTNGHTVIPFALKLEQNKPSAYSRYFVSGPGASNQDSLKQFNLSWWQKGKLLARAIYSWEAHRKLAALIDDAAVDLIYLLNICNYLSPSLIDAAKNRGIPVVMRLSDYNFACASYRFLRNGRVCTECLDKSSFWPALHYRCAEDSLLQTAGRVIPMTVHRMINILDKVDAFVAPSTTMAEALIRFGCDENKVNVVPSFVDLDEFQPAPVPRRKYALYAGRLDADKGVHVALNAWAQLAHDTLPLYIAGTGSAAANLEAQTQQLNLSAAKVRFLGQLDKRTLLTTLQQAAFVVAPSLWMDNSPMSVYESLACGQPVIGSAIGGIKNQVAHGETGFLFPPGDSAALADYAQRLLSDDKLRQKMGENARERAVTQFSPEAHYRRLGRIFRTLVGA
jgi:glycosyltransferase involved in cell wall biosynthesis